jgi:hypothetical protein
MTSYAKCPSLSHPHGMGNSITDSRFISKHIFLAGSRESVSPRKVRSFAEEAAVRSSQVPVWGKVGGEALMWTMFCIFLSVA